MSYYITQSGRRINLTTMSEKDIQLPDIAHHLTKICRYGGALALDRHYSVAQHSMLLAKYAKDNGANLNVQRALLLHDATEAYLGDIVSGLKELLPDYKSIEKKVNSLIAEKYGIVSTPYIEEVVKDLDTRILLDEALAFVPHHYEHFKEQLANLDPLGVTPHNEVNLSLTCQAFLTYCGYLGIKD